jgi:hypothetical protein
MQGSDFTKSRVGDRAWHIRFGKGEIVRIDENIGIWFQPNIPGYCQWIGFDGRIDKDDLLPSLYHDEIKFEIPLPPKRMVKKTIRVWVRMNDFAKNEIAEAEVTADEYTADTWRCKHNHRVEELSKEIEVEEQALFRGLSN